MVHFVNNKVQGMLAFIILLSLELKLECWFYCGESITRKISVKLASHVTANVTTDYITTRAAPTSLSEHCVHLIMKVTCFQAFEVGL